METTTVKAPDIECEGCASAIKKALGAVPGVNEVNVNVADKTVTVKHDKETAPRTAILAALDRAGFPAA
jgi:copper chaperone CopZ